MLLHGQVFVVNVTDDRHEAVLNRLLLLEFLVLVSAPPEARRQWPAQIDELAGLAEGDDALPAEIDRLRKVAKSVWDADVRDYILNRPHRR